MDRYDSVVVGAGCSGLVFSERLASSGFRVLLVDRRPEEELGRDSRDVVESAALELSCAPELIEGSRQPAAASTRFVSPDTSTTVPLQNLRLTVVDRKRLAAHLIARARSAGVRFCTGCTAVGLQLEKGEAVAVHTERGAFPCRLAVDASGAERVLCREMPASSPIPRRLGSGDYLAVYHETRGFVDAGESGETEPGVYEVHLGRNGGHSWIYLDDHGELDVGTAIRDVSGCPDPREIVSGYIRSNPSTGAEAIRRNGGRVPARRPLSSMVAHGQMLVGDSACQASPLLGRGVGGALTGATLAADAAARALEDGDLSVAGLWSYNWSYMMERGARCAADDCLRSLIVHMSADEVSWSMAVGLIDERALAAAAGGRPVVAADRSRLRSVFRAARGLPLLVRAENALRCARRALELYAQYPEEYDPPEFTEWSQEARFLFEESSRH